MFDVILYWKYRNSLATSLWTGAAALFNQLYVTNQLKSFYCDLHRI